MRKKKQRGELILIAVVSVAAIAISLTVSLIIAGPQGGSEQNGAANAVMLPYDASMPFSISDLTASQLVEIRQSGRMHVSDGPRGISIGDPLEKVLEAYPSTFTETLSSAPESVALSDEEMLLYCEENMGKLEQSEQTGMQSDEEIILYCAEYFVNQNGYMTALPPRGLLTVSGGDIVVTLLAPTSAYPSGTKDNYGLYEHVYCLYTIEPDTMTVREIILGIDQ